ncbi:MULTISPECIES: hypothetical protein [Akkermansia]|uniref:hypothetical protein n=1 Tax=Akkermansia TaxID=239934 RepID=UPI001BFF037D|nr:MULTISPECIES: hypothetical protein [Akkermansia]MBT8770254.1 hypothetical protein [Akkermansia muciniphila]MBS7152743.1 hypothetical protein [Akkermansia sp.]MBT8794280.1 hypothetical protein [Akkermansia muciniphila]MBT9563350.1 hypothetical protein [Candidatus Akkermansia timonensis]MDU7625132.1 hypothetical protein [Akkermansia sp.]
MRQENEPEEKTPSSHSNPVNFFPGLIGYGHPVQQAEQHLIGMTSSSSLFLQSCQEELPASFFLRPSKWLPGFPPHSNRQETNSRL